MERSYKRRRLDDDAEFDLHYRRAQNDRRLKSTFEDIFEKYGKDFDGVGDEIDLETGEIVVNNGHVLGMANERDTGDLEDQEGDEETEYESEDWSDSESMLASSLLLETGRRLDALKYAEIMDRTNEGDSELPSEGDADSLIGDTDSLIGDSILERLSPPPAQGRPFPPDSLCDDESEDELASSEVEWPTPRPTYTTPREVWPTPKAATPLSHTPWHASPLKPFRSNKPPIDPMWTAPPLPTDDGVRRPADSVIRPGLQKVDDVRFELPSQEFPPQSHDGRLPTFPMKPWKPAQDSNFQKSRRLVKRETPSNSPAKKSQRQRTEEEENKSIQSRTTTKQVYSEIEQYIPGRETKAITIQWLETTRKDRDRSSLHGSPAVENAVRSSNHNSPWRFENNVTRIKNPVTAREMLSPRNTDPRSHHHNEFDIHDPLLPILGPGSCSPPSRIKQISKHHEIKAPGSRNSIKSQGSPSMSQHDTGHALLYRESPFNVSTLEEVKEEEGEVNVIKEALISSAAKPGLYHATPPTMPTVTARAPSQASSQTLINNKNQRESRPVRPNQTRQLGDVPRVSLPTDRVSTSQRPSSSTSKKPVFLPSYLADDSDDELSTPFKTVGAHQNIL